MVETSHAIASSNTSVSSHRSDKDEDEDEEVEELARALERGMNPDGTCVIHPNIRLRNNGTVYACSECMRNLTTPVDVLSDNDHERSNGRNNTNFDTLLGNSSDEREETGADIYVDEEEEEDWHRDRQQQQQKKQRRRKSNRSSHYQHVHRGSAPSETMLSYAAFEAANRRVDCLQREKDRMYDHMMKEKRVWKKRIVGLQDLLVEKLLALAEREETITRLEKKIKEYERTIRQDVKAIKMAVVGKSRRRNSDTAAGTTTMVCPLCQEEQEEARRRIQHEHNNQEEENETRQGAPQEEGDNKRDESDDEQSFFEDVSDYNQHHQDRQRHHQQQQQREVQRTAARYAHTTTSGIVDGIIERVREEKIIDYQDDELPSRGPPPQRRRQQQFHQQITAEPNLHSFEEVDAGKESTKFPVPTFVGSSTKPRGRADATVSLLTMSSGCEIEKKSHGPHDDTSKKSSSTASSSTKKSTPLPPLPENDSVAILEEIGEEEEDDGDNSNPSNVVSKAAPQQQSQKEADPHIPRASDVGRNDEGASTNTAAQERQGASTKAAAQERLEHSHDDAVSRSSETTRRTIATLSSATKTTRPVMGPQQDKEPTPLPMVTRHASESSVSSSELAPVSPIRMRGLRQSSMPSITSNISHTERVHTREVVDGCGTKGVYTGTMARGKPNGYGIMKYYYDDDDDDDNNDEDSKATNATEVFMTFDGEWKDGHWHGQGKLVRGVGDKHEVYEGDFEHDDRHGRGTHQYDDGRLYVGEFRHDKRHGIGKLEDGEGAYYQGAFENGFQHGYGSAVLANNDGTYTGEWQDSRFWGNGERQYADGSVYTGQFERGQRHGQGTLRNPNGTIQFQGEWANDEPNKKDQKNTP